MTTKPLRYGLVGCGMMGQEHIRNIQLLPDTQIAAVYEPELCMQGEVARLAPGVEFASSFSGLIERDDLDCLVIASPNHMHLEQLQQIANTNPLPILVEKPLATQSGAEAEIKQLQANYPEQIWVAMEYRYMPPVAELIKNVSDVTGGVKMLTIREHRFPFLDKVGHWNRFNKYSGGTFVEKCCHFFDLMRLIVQSEPVRIMASGAQDNNHLDEVYDGETSDILDNGYVIVDFENGARAMLELCMFAEGSRYQEEISAVGSKGKIECFVPGPGRFWPSHLGEAPTPQVAVSPREPKGPRVLEVPVDPELLEAGDHNGSTFYQHQKFRDVVRGKQGVEVTLMDGWKAVKMGMAAQESAASGQSVELSI